MRYREINELAGVKRFRDMTSIQVIDYINNNLGSGPIKILGRGASGVAVLIGESVYKFWLVDSAYTNYVNYCLDNQDNPFLPKFLSGIKKMPAFFLSHKDAPDYVQYIKMEHLSPIRNINDLEFEISNKSKMMVSLSKVCRIAEKYPNDRDVALSEIVDCAFDWDVVNIKNLTPHITQLTTTMMDIINIIEQHRTHHLDMGDANVMKRGNQLVIIDPIADTEDLRLNRMFTRFDFNPTKGTE